MQKNGLIVKFPLFNKNKHITIVGDSNCISFHVTDEAQTDRALRYPYRIQADFPDIDPQQFDCALLAILLKHLKIYPIDKLPWRRYLTLGSLVNSEYSHNLLNKKSRLSIIEYAKTGFVVNRRYLKQVEMKFWFTVRRKSGASGKWWVDGIVVIDLMNNIGCYLPLVILKEIVDYSSKLFKIEKTNFSFNESPLFKLSRSEMDRLRRNFKLFLKTKDTN